MPDHPANWRRALEMLATSDNGCTTALLLAHDVPSALIDQLISDGFATATTEAKLGNRLLDVTRVRITDAGRKALEG